MARSEHEKWIRALHHELGVGEVVHTGGGIFNLVIEREDGGVVAITEEIVQSYDSMDSFENNTEEMSILLPQVPTSRARALPGRMMPEERYARALARLFGGKVEHTGGNNFAVVLVDRKDGRTVVITHEGVWEYDNLHEWDIGADYTNGINFH